MENRHTLYIRKLEDFKKCLVKDGWEIKEPKGIYERLRARKFDRNNPMIVHKKGDVEEYLKIMHRDRGVVGAILSDCKKAKTNADRIRSMSDEELAEFIEGLNDHCLAGIGEVDCSNTTGTCSESCKKIVRVWLQSEVEE